MFAMVMMFQTGHTVVRLVASQVQKSSETKTNLNIPLDHLVTLPEPASISSFISDGVGAKIIMFQTLYSEKNAADAAFTGWRKMLSKAGRTFSQIIFLLWTFVSASQEWRSSDKLYRGEVEKSWCCMEKIWWSSLQVWSYKILNK